MVAGFHKFLPDMIMEKYFFQNALTHMFNWSFDVSFILWIVRALCIDSTIEVCKHDKSVLLQRHGRIIRLFKDPGKNKIPVQVPVTWSAVY